MTSVETGGFAAAGRKLGVSASAIGKAVRRLEKSLGVRLLQRTTRSISPTTEGELLYVRSVRILEDVREAEDAISKTRSVPRGRLKVSVPTVLGSRVLVPALPRFMADYPEIEIELELDFNDRLVDVVADGFDLVVRTGEMSSSRLIARKLGPHQFVTCGSLRGYEVSRGHVWLVWPPGRKDAPKVRVFADFVRRLFK